MDRAAYDVWYDPNEVDATNHAHVMRAWARDDLLVTLGNVILVGDDELDPVPARIVGFDETTEIITIEILFGDSRAAVA